MRRAPALLLLVLLAAGCGADPPAARPASPSPVGDRPRVDSVLCDDLRTVVRDPEPGVAQRVLAALGASSGAPADVLAALREVQAGARRTESRDAVLATFLERECGGL